MIGAGADWAALPAATRMETWPVTGAGRLALGGGGGWMWVCTPSKCPPGLACISPAGRGTTVLIVELLFVLVKSGWGHCK